MNRQEIRQNVHKLHNFITRLNAKQQLSISSEYGTIIIAKPSVLRNPTLCLRRGFAISNRQSFNRKFTWASDRQWLLDPVQAVNMQLLLVNNMFLFSISNNHTVYLVLAHMSDIWSIDQIVAWNSDTNYKLDRRFLRPFKLQNDKLMLNSINIGT